MDNEEREIKEIVRMVLKLSYTELNILSILNDAKEGVSLEYIYTHMNKHRTTMQKLMNNLEDKKYVFKKQINLNRGYMYIYFPAMSKSQFNNYFLDELNKLVDKITSYDSSDLLVTHKEGL